MKNMEKKYELIPSDKEGLYRIKALKDFNNVKKGDIGGYVESENNLSQLDDCWIYDNAIVCGNAQVCNYANVYHNANVYGDAVVCNYANVYHNAKVFGNAIIRDNAVVRGNAIIFDNAIVCDNANIRGEVCICGDAMISSDKDYIVFKNWWSSGRYFTWTRSNNMWKVGCFYGSGEELITKAYKDSEESGREYECIVKYVERILNTEECKTNK